MPIDRRTRKRLATRQAISDAATRLFYERGFDSVTIDEIAEAADVGRKTVFNHFARKEDMFFDKEEELSVAMRDAVSRSTSDLSPLEALRTLAHGLISERSTLVEFSVGSRSFMDAMEKSDTLKARARAAQDELASALAKALYASARWEFTETEARLTATLFVATWNLAVAEAHMIFRQSQNTKEANAAFLALVDQGTTGLRETLRARPQRRVLKSRGRAP
jgi:AcrR family transcriptional regulator